MLRGVTFSQDFLAPQAAVGYGFVVVSGQEGANRS